MWTEDDIILRLRVDDDTVSVLSADEANEIAGTFEELRKARDEWRDACLAHGEKARLAQAEARELREALNRIIEWYQQDGSVGTCSLVMGEAKQTLARIDAALAGKGDKNG